MNVTVITHTPEPEKVVAQAAKLCYSNSNIEDLLGNMSDETIDKYITKLVDMGHMSPIEHVSFSFGIEGVSRSLLAQITRHRISSFSVQSQRYVRFDNPEYVTPPAISFDDECNAIFQESMNASIESYKTLTNKLIESYMNNPIFVESHGKDSANAAEKRAIEDARYVLPNASYTKIFMTMNVRSLYNLFKLRCCNRAQWEIRELAKTMWEKCYEISPALFEHAGPSCVTTGVCSEGKMCCGEKMEVKKWFDDKKMEIEANKSKNNIDTSMGIYDDVYRESGLL